MTSIVLYLSTAAIFLVLDAVMLTTVMKPRCERHRGDTLLQEIRLAPAVLFYLFYIFALQWLVTGQAVQDGPSWRLALSAALFGAVAYGTYDLTNAATLKGWSLTVTVVDMLWGAFLAGLSAAIGVWVALRFI